MHQDFVIHHRTLYIKIDNIRYYSLQKSAVLLIYNQVFFPKSCSYLIFGSRFNPVKIFLLNPTLHHSLLTKIYSE